MSSRSCRQKGKTGYPAALVHSSIASRCSPLHVAGGVQIFVKRKRNPRGGGALSFWISTRGHQSRKQMQDSSKTVLCIRALINTCIYVCSHNLGCFSLQTLTCSHGLFSLGLQPVTSAPSASCIKAKQHDSLEAEAKMEHKLRRGVVGSAEQGSVWRSVEQQFVGRSVHSGATLSDLYYPYVIFCTLQVAEPGCPSLSTVLRH